MCPSISVGGDSFPLTVKEAKEALHAVAAYRRRLSRYTKVPVKRERDLQMYDLHERGMTDCEIARAHKTTVLKVRSAIKRVDGGRYDASGGDGG